MKNNVLLKKFIRTRNQSLEICKNIELEDYSIQPHADISPPKWHLAHTSWFYEELILSKLPRIKIRYNNEYKLLYNSYYKSAGKHWEQSKRGLLSRPTVKEVIQYRKYVDKEIIKLIKDSKENFKQKYLIELGIHHEQQHQELLFMDIKYILGINPSYPKFKKSILPRARKNARRKWKKFTEGIYEIGHDGNEFSYDNEKPKHKKYIYPFQIQHSFVSNFEYLNFIKYNGYKKAKHWLSKGWEWVNNNNICSPLYWHQINNKWYEFTLYGLKKLDLNAPVCHISYYEASAYSNWSGCRLPTEHESEIFLKNYEGDDKKNSKNIVHPTDIFRSDNNLWWWTRSHYSAYPRYIPYKGTIEEYNEKFMCGQFVLKGGAVVTPNNHHRYTYRNFYEPHQRWMFSGIRLAKDLK